MSRVRRGLARGLAVLVLAAGAACASDSGPDAPRDTRRVDDYYGGSIHRNSFPETFGTRGVVRPGRPY